MAITSANTNVATRYATVTLTITSVNKTIKTTSNGLTSAIFDVKSCTQN